jgi:hypothetical protein
MTREKRGIGTMIVAAVGISGGLLAACTTWGAAARPRISTAPPGIR